MSIHEGKPPTHRSGTVWSRLLKLLALNLTGATLAYLLFSLFEPADYAHGPGKGIIISLIYANSIGTLLFLLLPVFARSFARLRFPLNWALLIAQIVVVATAGCLIAGTILIELRVLPSVMYWGRIYFELRFSAIMALIFGISFFLYETMRERLEKTTLALRTTELAEERARKFAAEARLATLESRIHPHFLFNTLNSISALIPEDPRLAESTVLRLAALLRFSLDANGMVTLRRELQIVVDYLEIEQARFGNRLRYSIDVPEELHSADVPSLAVQSLVENSVKHAISPRREGGMVGVSARSDGIRLELDVSDDGPGFSPEAIVSGHGLANLQARLEAMFGNGGRIDILRLDGRQVVRISIPRRESDLR